MANGWARDGAVQEQIDASVEDAINQVRSKLSTGASLRHCEDCGVAIPQARRNAIAGVRLCIECQRQREDERHF